MPSVLKVPRGTVVKYGLAFPPKAGDSPYNALDIEFACFLRGGTKQTAKYDHCANLIRLLWPKLYIHSWMERLLRAFCDNNYTGITGCANSAKSFTMAAWALLSWWADPLHTLVFIVSTSKLDAKRRVWAHVQRLHREVALPMPGKMLHSVDSIALRDMKEEDMGSDASAIILVAAGDSSDKALQKLQGAKNDRVILEVDEGQDVTPTIEDAMFNLKNNNHFEFRVAGNPSQPHDFHGRFLEPALLGGHDLDLEDVDSWPILALGMHAGTAIHFNAVDSPNFARQDAGLPLLPYLPKPIDVTATRAALGRDDPRLWRQSIGVWPRGISIKQTVFTSPETIQYGIRNKIDLTSVRYGMGIDPAWVEDGDDYIITIFQLGSSPTSGGVFQLETQITLREEAWTDPATSIVHTATRSKAKRTVAIARQYGIKVNCVGMDATGALAYADMLDEEFELAGKAADLYYTQSQGILRVNFGESAGEELPVSVLDDRVGRDLYFNKAAELWMRMHSLAEHGQLKGISDPDLLKQLTMRKTILRARGRTAIEGKKDFKKRTGGKSPDKADSLVVAGEVAFARMGVIPGQQVIETRITEWNQQVQRSRVPVARLQGTGGLQRLTR